MEALIIQLISGAVGGNVAGALLMSPMVSVKLSELILNSCARNGME